MNDYVITEVIKIQRRSKNQAKGLEIINNGLSVFCEGGCGFNEVDFLPKFLTAVVHVIIIDQ